MSGGRRIPFFARARDESGQAIVFVVALLVIVIGMAALVIDGGSWLRAQRHLQTAADAGALAGAQNLPIDQTGARNTAINYAQTNYSTLPAPTVTFPDSATIDVAAQTTAPGFLSKIYGAAFNNVTIRAHARASLSAPEALGDVAPVAIRRSVACAVTNPGCYGTTVTVSFTESQISTSVLGLIDLRCPSTTSSVSCPSGPGADTLRDWIKCAPCYSGKLHSSRWYGVKTGENIGPIKQGFQDAADARRVLFFPVFDTADAANKSFHVIGWAAFVIDPTGVVWTSSTKRLTGHFTTYLATDIAAGDPIDPNNDFGVYIISLIQ